MMLSRQMSDGRPHTACRYFTHIVERSDPELLVLETDRCLFEDPKFKCEPLCFTTCGVLALASTVLYKSILPASSPMRRPCSSSCCQTAYRGRLQLQINGADRLPARSCRPHAQRYAQDLDNFFLEYAAAHKKLAENVR